MENQFQKEAIAKHEMDIVYNDLSKAANQNEELSDESRNIYADYYNKILLYSAGAFSFITTLIGFVLPDKPSLLAKVSFFLPNIYWLYISMSFFLLAGFSVLLSKRFDAEYTRNFGMRNYLEKLKIKEETMLKMMQKHDHKFLITKNGSPQQEIDTANKNIPKIDKGLKESKQQQEFSYKAMHFFHITSEWFSFIATIVLFIFVIILSQTIVWG